MVETPASFATSLMLTRFIYFVPQQQLERLQFLNKNRQTIYINVSVALFYYETQCLSIPFFWNFLWRQIAPATGKLYGNKLKAIHVSTHAWRFHTGCSISFAFLKRLWEMLCNVIFRLSSAHSQKADKKESVQSCLWQQMPMVFPAARGSMMEMVRWALAVLPLVTTPGSKKCPPQAEAASFLLWRKGGTLFSVGFAFSALLARENSAQMVGLLFFAIYITHIRYFPAR